MKRLLTSSLIVILSVATSAQLAPPSGDVPAYNAAPPAKGQKLPPILSGDQLSGASFQYPVQARAYKAAAKASRVIHQLPCYCHCDRTAGHNSLHSCFESEHGAHCSTCMKEAFFAEEMTAKGKTPAQIRAAIIKGDFEKVDLQKLNEN
jgi:uncharacterized protein with PCYCGC motif